MGSHRRVDVVLRCAAAALGAFVLSEDTAAQQIQHSTHDWTAPELIGQDVLDFREGWADVKTPGNGRTYAVGTIDARNTQDSAFPLAEFSGQSATPSLPADPGFGLPGLQTRQVAILQVTDAAQTILWQRYFYGSSGTFEASARPTNARAISVWPANRDQDTRIAICGETWDAFLPLGNTATPVLTANGTNAGGFIAVYDGSGTLLWTHHFFGSHSGGDCAVTDVSIRVAFENGNPVRDVVTYCGISSLGGAGGSLTPINPFVPPSGSSPCNPAGGATDNGPGQWDGFVGRLVRNHFGPGGTWLFHAVVGGNQQDTLFGISELPEDIFVVVGSTAGGRTVPAPSPSHTHTYPWSTPQVPACHPTVPMPSTGYCVGTILLFDATATSQATPGRLVLAAAYHVGAFDAGSTILRDVMAHSETKVNNSNARHSVFAVGSTSTGQPTAGVDGLATLAFVSTSTALDLQLVFQDTRGGPFDDGLTGVQGWNEFGDHVAVTGFTTDAAGNRNIDVASYHFFSGPRFATAFLIGTELDGGSDEYPTAMGTNQVATAQTPIETFGLGDPAGGGVAQDRNGRVSVVGSTRSLAYPVAGGRGRSTTLVPAGNAAVYDAVRTALDLLPAGVGRTDGTGSIPLPIAFPRPNTNGGTTPPCALRPFGKQIGLPPPPMARLLIDVDAALPTAGGRVGVIVDRVPDTGGFVIAGLQLGIPGDPTNFLPIHMMPDGLELWTINTPVVLGHAWPTNASVHEIIQVPPPPLTFTVQVALLLSVPIPAGNPAAGGGCGGTTMVAASPALCIRL